MPQLVQLMEGTVLENIGFEDAAIDPNKVEQFLKSNGLGLVFDSFPQGIHTVIGEGGYPISGGQAQLIVLGRALYRKLDLLLLDELGAGLDATAENQVYNLLQKIRCDLIILMVSPRGGLIDACDKVIEL